MCLSIRNLVDFVFRIGNKFDPQVSLEEFKCFVKEKKIPEYITGDREISFNDFDRKDFDKENSNEENSDEEN